MKTPLPRPLPRKGGGENSVSGRWIPAVAGMTFAFVLLAPAMAAAQQSGSDGTEVLYRREVYEYQRGVRSDPFRSLLGSVDLGVRFEDLSVNGIAFSDNARESVAILVEGSTQRRIRARVGERIGAMTVVAILPRRVDLVIEEFGVPRRESLYLKADPETGS